MLQNIFDTHAHYDDECFDVDRAELLHTLHNDGVCNIVNIGAGLKRSELCVKLANEFDFVYATVGIHPLDVNETPENYIAELRSLAQDKKVVAIGEIGLDYFYQSENKELQKRMFREQIELARELDLPVVLHDRDAHADTMDILRETKPRGIMHCYSGSLPMAQELIEMGFYISFTGVITFKNAKKAVEVVKEIPLERLLVETDCPYMAPEPFRGKRCDSGMIHYSLHKIAEIRGMDAQELANITAENARRVYGINR